MRISNELQIGKAGEYFVCFDLVLKGYVAFLSEQGLPYDVLLDNGNKLIRIQVKTCSGPRVVPQRVSDTTAYIFNIKRHGKNNSQRYGNDEVDIFALVCLDTKMVGYIKSDDMPDTLNLRVDAMRGTYYDEKGVQDYNSVMALKDRMSQTQISKELNLAIATVNRMCQPKYKPFQTNARYFSDIVRDADWFL